jgi:hypothetical protein
MYLSYAFRLPAYGELVLSVPTTLIQTGKEELDIAQGRKHTPKQIASMLRQIAIDSGHGKVGSKGCLTLFRTSSYDGVLSNPSRYTNS